MLYVRHNLLPHDSEQRHATLREYFCDKDAKATWTEANWELSLAWPDGVERHVDPALHIGLDWWGGGVSRPTMAFARRRTCRILRALYDTWTLHSWSELYRHQRISPNDHIAILHVDDHFDFAPPRLICEGPKWIDALTGSDVDIGRPESIEAAIASGAIGMGSFLTPFLHYAQSAEVRHLRQPPKTHGTLDYVIRRATVPDTLLYPGAPRPCIYLDPAESTSGPGTYRVTSSIRDWLDGLNAKLVVLHVDLDYFNNRYDGDSDWKSRTHLLDPPKANILQKIDEIADALQRTFIKSKLLDISVAFSPGFFPAEYWRDADYRLASHFELE